MIGGDLVHPRDIGTWKSFLSDWAVGKNPQTKTDLAVIDDAIDSLKGGSGRDLFVVGQGDTNDSKNDGDVVISA